MGQKVHPTSVRLGINETWDIRWSHNIHYGQFFQQDLQVRRFIQSLCKYNQVLLGQFTTWRTPADNALNFDLYKKAANKGYLFVYFQIFLPTPNTKDIKWVRELQWKAQEHIQELVGSDIQPIVNIDPIWQSKSNTFDDDIDFLTRWLIQKDSVLLAQWIASEIRKRKGLKDILKKIEKAYKQVDNQDAHYLIKGIKVSCSGRFRMTAGEKRTNQMARTKSYKKGQIPLQTLSQQISYSYATAHTVEGTSGIKVWISYKNKE
uniref:Small ribosomal subunit protein uS3m n=1 Tax=Seculamonas ecuadoriensis TaxID=221724 RepID=M4QMC2_SECEC|nr:ribosomal protein S3 [Seculamonas ecuadoriensis]AGH24508.1 ribosomal protein S3 [Seculamonas ecuadoriensis]